MNANRYRIIFNRARGLLMAVAEIASAHSKSSGETRAGTTATTFTPALTLARLRPAAFATLLAFATLGAQLAVVPLAQAQIVAYKAAPASQRPTVLTAGNGVPLINIQTPSAAGVSRNTYSQFDVDANGVILNNARNNALTQLGGWVQGNPWLARGSARIILNEVVSGSPSQLLGYIEVAGSSAQVIIANPAGIACNGCGFISASRATLTTGTPIINGGNLESYRVEGGTISINGAGMDASRSAYTDLIARAVEVNAGLWAQTLKVTTGSNVVDADNSSATPIASSGPAPTFAIDVASLGGMYAGKITLVGTEAGVGVRNAGWIGASAGEVIVTVDGRLLNSGSIISATHTQIDTSGNIVNSGIIYAQGDASLSSRGNIDNTKATLAANDNVNLSALSIDNTQGVIGSVSGKVVADASAGALINRAGQIEAAQNITLSSTGLTNADGAIVGQSTVTLTTGNLDNTAGLIVAKGALSIDSAVITNTTGASLTSEKSLSITGTNIDNRGGQIQALDDVSVQISGAVNTAGSLIRAGQSLSLTANNVDNSNTLGVDQGIEGQSLAITASQINNSAGALRADQTLSLTSGGNINNSGGLISSAHTLQILDPKATPGSNAPTKTLAVTNTGGTLIADQQLTVDSASLSGDGALLSLGNIDVKLLADYTHGGPSATFAANGNATLETAGILTNRAGIKAGNSLALKAASINNEATGKIVASTVNLTATDSHTLTNRGLIDGSDTFIDSTSVNNLGTGRIYGDHVAISATTLTNDAETVSGVTSAPVIAARGNTGRLDLAASTINNHEGALLFSAGDLSIGGVLDGSHQATGQAGTLNNVSARIEALGNLAINVATLNNSRTTFSFERQLESTLTNSRTRCDDPPDCDYISYLTDQTTIYKDVVTSTSPAASILAGGNFALNATNLSNQYSSIEAGGKLSLTGTTLTNQGAELFQQTDEIHSGYYRHWGRSPKGHWTSASSSSTLLATVPAIISAGGDLSGSYTGLIDNITIRQNTAPIVAPSGTTITALDTGSVTQVPAGASAAGSVIRTVTPATTLPASSLFRSNPIPTGNYLIETDPQFAGYRQWLTSDTMLRALSLNPATTQKRLGDGFYEQRLINEQVAQLTGRRFLVGYASDETQYQALMDAGVTYAKAWNLIPGIALSAEQMAALTTDMVWLVEKTVTLADGSTQNVLVPQVYARLREGDLTPSGALLAGNSIDLNTDSDLTNSGSIAGRQIVALTAENIKNLAGRISGKETYVAARNDLTSIGGIIEAQDRLIASAGHDLTVQSRAVDLSFSQNGKTANSVKQTVIDRVAGLYVTGANGTLVASAGNDLGLLAAAIINAAPTAAGVSATNSGTPAGGSTLLVAGNNINIGTVTETSSALSTSKKARWSETKTTEVGTLIQTSGAGGTLTLLASNDVTARAATVSSEGALTAQAGNNLTIEAGQATYDMSYDRKSSKRGLMSSSSKTTRDTVSTTTALASTFSGDSTTLIADRDIAIKGSNVVATNDVTLLATRDIKIESATETHNETHFKQTKQSGIFSSGGVGITLGSKQQSTDQKTDATLAAKSTLGSTDGNVTLLAGENYRQVGTDVIAVKGDIDIAAKTVDILEARQTSRTVTETKSKQSGLTLAVTSPVINAIQTAQQMSEAASNTKDPRMKLLAAANVGMTANNAVDAIKAGQGTTIGGKEGQMPVVDSAGKDLPSRDANAADQVGGIGINLSLGGSKNSSKTTQTSNTAAASNLTAGRDITITASGAGEASDLTIQGSKLTAARNLTLAAEDEMKLLAAANTNNQKSTNQNSSASVGIGFMVGGTQNGFTIQAGVSGGQGKAKGNDLNWSNTQVEAGKTLTLESGGDTTLKGATAKGEQVIANVGKNLKIESLQDTSTYDSKQQSLGVSVSLCIPPFCYGAASSGSVSASGSKVNSDFASVDEQSAIRAGDGGFQVAVKGDTDLKGGAITSTQQAINDNKNTFQTDGELTISDIQNKAEYTAKSASINVGTGFSAAGALTPGGTSAGFGKDGDKAESTTLASISGVAGNKDARTGDKESGIAKIFDQTKVQKEIDAQTKITQMFNQLAPKAAADYAGNQVASLRKQAESETDMEKQAALLDEAKKWAPNGSYNIAMNIIIGAAGGNANSAITKETLSWAANEMRQNMIKDSERFKGLCDTQGNCISNMSGKSAGANGDEKKIAGGRIVLADWCADGRCTEAPADARTTSGYVENPDGTVKFNPGVDADGKPMTLTQFVDANQSWRSELGGHQGGLGQMKLFGTQFNYEKGSFWDKLAEAYSGTHDTLNSPIWYDKLGNSKNLDNTLIGNIGDITNMTNVVLATPFALSVILPPEVWNSILTLIKLKQ